MQKIKVRGQTEKAFVFVLRLAECPDSSMITAFIVNLFETPVVMQRCLSPEDEMLPHLMSH